MGRRWLSVRVRGPLACYAEGFPSELHERGFTEVSSWHKLGLFGKLSRWLELSQLEPSQLTSSQVNRFLNQRRTAAPTGPRGERALEPMLTYLRRLGAVPEAEIERPQGAVEVLLERYGEYLDGERGLTATTISRYQAIARLFLEGRVHMQGLDLSGLTAKAVTEFLLREVQPLGVGSAKNLVTALRSSLRFLHVNGDAPPLADVVPGVSGWGVASLPRGLPPDQIGRLLESCDPSNTAGRRDHAILTLLVRLGLRAKEVVVLGLDDFDWRRAEVVIRGKGGQREALPPPADVGEAVSSYLLNARPKCSSRRLFLRLRAPFDSELTVSGVKAVVRTACQRAGVPPIGTHRLRHTTATEMLRAGASLTEIGQVLRHHSLGTTAIYAKVDRTALRELARPWPGSVK